MRSFIANPVKHFRESGFCFLSGLFASQKYGIPHSQENERNRLNEKYIIVFIIIHVVLSIFLVTPNEINLALFFADKYSGMSR